MDTTPRPGDHDKRSDSSIFEIQAQALLAGACAVIQSARRAGVIHVADYHYMVTRHQVVRWKAEDELGEFRIEMSGPSRHDTIPIQLMTWEPSGQSETRIPPAVAHGVALALDPRTFQPVDPNEYFQFSIGTRRTWWLADSRQWELVREDFDISENDYPSIGSLYEGE